MNKIGVASFFMLILCLISFRVGYAQQIKEPKLKFLESRIINVDSIKAGQEYKVSLSYKNTGQQDLIIKDINKTCNCTEVVLSKKILRTGETGQIDISVDTEGKRGANTIVVTLTTNSVPHSSIIRINLNVTD